MAELPDNAPAPRLCHIVKWPDFDGYGFNLHADKSRPGQYIGKVDNDSPAEMAGLKEYDRIIEVNGVNISNENHKQVVQRIKSIENETRLLVVDRETDQWFKTHNIVINGTLANVVVGSSLRVSKDEEEEGDPAPPATTNGHVTPPPQNGEDSRSVGSAESSHESESSTQPRSPMSVTPATTPTPPPSEQPPAPKTPPKASPALQAKLEKSGLNLNMTAAEMRAQLAAKKKIDPRKDTIDLKKKYQMIQNM